MISPAELLQVHTVSSTFDHFASGDPSETESYATNLYCPHDFRLAPRDRQLGSRMASASLFDVGLASIGFRANVTVDPGRLGEFYLVQSVVSGSVDVHSGSQRFLSTPGTATVVSPNQPTRMTWDRDAHFLSVKIDRLALERRLAQMLGRRHAAPVVFDLEMNLRRNDSKPWLSAVDTLFHHLQYSPWQASDPDAGRLLEQWLISTLLHTQRHNYSDALCAQGGVDAPRAVRAAAAFIDRNFRQRLSVQMVAEQVGVSERKLSKLFKQHLGKTVLQYRKDVQLRCVNSELGTGHHQHSVTQVLFDAGVQHLGRFAAAYRQRFGELPSETAGRKKT